MIDDHAIPAVLSLLLQSRVISLGDYEFTESLQDYYQRFGRLSFKQKAALQMMVHRDTARKAKVAKKVKQPGTIPEILHSRFSERKSPNA